MNECYALFVNRALTLGFVHVVCSSNIVKVSKHVLRNVNGHAVKKNVLLYSYIYCQSESIHGNFRKLSTIQPINNMGWAHIMKSAHSHTHYTFILEATLALYAWFLCIISFNQCVQCFATMLQICLCNQVSWATTFWIAEWTLSVHALNPLAWPCLSMWMCTLLISTERSATQLIYELASGTRLAK